MIGILTQHEKIAFQFSGGRDSLAALYLLRPHWDLFTVYHLDTGDQFPEVQEIVRQVEAEVPRFVRIPGRVAESIATHGWPSDLVPIAHHTFVGRAVSGESLKIQDRYDCCFRSLMAPLHERMAADGVTLVIRGQRDADYTAPVTRSGFKENGTEFYYPLQDWSADNVMDYLKSIGVEPAPFYSHGMKTSPDCMHCSAWWDENRAQYLKRFHPGSYQIYTDRLRVLQEAVAPAVALLHRELKE